MNLKKIIAYPPTDMSEDGRGRVEFCFHFLKTLEPDYPYPSSINTWKDLVDRGEFDSFMMNEFMPFFQPPTCAVDTYNPKLDDALVRGYQFNSQKKFVQSLKEGITAESRHHWNQNKNLNNFYHLVANILEVIPIETESPLKLIELSSRLTLTLMEYADCLQMSLAPGVGQDFYVDLCRLMKGYSTFLIARPCMSDFELANIMIEDKMTEFCRQYQDIKNIGALLDGQVRESFSVLFSVEQNPRLAHPLEESKSTLKIGVDAIMQSFFAKLSHTMGLVKTQVSNELLKQLNAEALGFNLQPLALWDLLSDGVPESMEM